MPGEQIRPNLTTTSFPVGNILMTASPDVGGSSMLVYSLPSVISSVNKSGVSSVLQENRGSYQNVNSNNSCGTNEFSFQHNGAVSQTNGNGHTHARSDEIYPAMQHSILQNPMRANRNSGIDSLRDEVADMIGLKQLQETLLKPPNGVSPILPDHSPVASYPAQSIINNNAHVASNGNFRFPDTPIPVNSRPPKHAFQPKSPATTGSFTKDFLEYIQSPRVRNSFDEEEDENESQKFWICDPAVYKKDQESRMKGEHITAKGMTVVVDHDNEVNARSQPTVASSINTQKLIDPSTTSRRSITAQGNGLDPPPYEAVEGVGPSENSTGSRIGQVPNTTSNPIPVVLYTVDPVPQVEQAGARERSVSSTYVRPRQQSIEEEMPKIVACYSLNPKADTDIEPDRENLKSPLRGSGSANLNLLEKKNSPNPKTPLTKVISPLGKKGKSPGKTGNVALYEASIAKTVAKAKVLADWRGEVLPRYNVTVLDKRASSASPLGVDSPVELTEPRTRHESTEYYHKGKPAQYNAKKKTRRKHHKVPTTDAVQLPETTTASSLERWIKSTRTTAPNMHVVGNYPAPIVISKNHHPSHSVPSSITQQKPTMGRGSLSTIPSKLVSASTSHYQIVYSKTLQLPLPSSAPAFTTGQLPRYSTHIKNRHDRTVASTTNPSVAARHLNRGKSHVTPSPQNHSNVFPSSSSKSFLPNLKATQRYPIRVNVITSNRLVLPKNECNNSSIALPRPGDSKSPSNVDEPLDFSMKTLCRLEREARSVGEQDAVLDLSLPRRRISTSSATLSSTVHVVGENNLTSSEQSSASVSVSNFSSYTRSKPLNGDLDTTNLDTLCSIASLFSSSNAANKTLKQFEIPLSAKDTTTKDHTRKTTPRKQMPNASEDFPPYIHIDALKDNTGGVDSQMIEKKFLTSDDEPAIGVYFDINGKKSSNEKSSEREVAPCPASKQASPEPTTETEVQSPRTGQKVMGEEEVLSIQDDSGIKKRVNNHIDRSNIRVKSDGIVKESEHVLRESIFSKKINNSRYTEQQERDRTTRKDNFLLDQILGQVELTSAALNELSNDHINDEVTKEVSAALASQVDEITPSSDENVASVEQQDGDSVADFTNVSNVEELPAVKNSSHQTCDIALSTEPTQENVLGSNSAQDISKAIETSSPTSEEITATTACEIDQNSPENGDKIHGPATPTSSDIPKEIRAQEVVDIGIFSDASECDLVIDELDPSVASKQDKIEGNVSYEAEKTKFSVVKSIETEEVVESIVKTNAFPSEEIIERAPELLEGVPEPAETLLKEDPELVKYHESENSKSLKMDAQKNALLEEISKGRNSPNVTLCRLNSSEMRTNFSVTSDKEIINIRPESLDTMIRAKQQKDKLSSVVEEKVEEKLEESDSVLATESISENPTTSSSIEEKSDAEHIAKTVGDKTSKNGNIGCSPRVLDDKINDTGSTLSIDPASADKDILDHHDEDLGTRTDTCTEDESAGENKINNIKIFAGGVNLNSSFAQDEPCCDGYDDMFLNEDDIIKDTTTEENSEKEGTKESAENRRRTDEVENHEKEIGAEGREVIAAEDEIEEQKNVVQDRPRIIQELSSITEDLLLKKCAGQDGENDADSLASSSNEFVLSSTPFTSPSVEKGTISFDSDTVQAKRKTSIKLGYNVHANVSGSDIKIKRRKLVKKNETPQPKIPKTTPKQSDLTYILLSDSSDSSDETGSFFKTKKVTLKRRKARKSTNDDKAPSQGSSVTKATPVQIKEELPEKSPDQTVTVGHADSSAQSSSTTPPTVQLNLETPSTLKNLFPDNSNASLPTEKDPVMKGIESPVTSPIQSCQSTGHSYIPEINALNPDAGTANMIGTPKSQDVPSSDSGDEARCGITLTHFASPFASSSPEDDATLRCGLSPTTSDDSDIQTPKKIRLKSFVRDPTAFDPQENSGVNHQTTEPITKTKQVKTKLVKKGKGVSKKKTRNERGKLVPKVKRPAFTVSSIFRKTGPKKGMKRKIASGIVEFDPYFSVTKNIPKRQESLKNFVDKIIAISPPKLSKSQSETKKARLYVSGKRTITDSHSEALPSLTTTKSVEERQESGDSPSEDATSPKRTARMGRNWTPVKMPDVATLSNNPLPYREPERLSKAERDRNIYLTMQKLLNVGLIMDQMPGSSQPAWPSSFKPMQQNEANRPASPVSSPPNAETKVPKEEFFWYTREHVDLIPCSVVMKKLYIEKKTVKLLLF